MEAMLDVSLSAAIALRPRCRPEPWLDFARMGDLSEVPPWLTMLPVTLQSTSMESRSRWKHIVRWTSHNRWNLNVRPSTIEVFVGVISSSPSNMEQWPDFSSMTKLKVIEMTSKGWQLLSECGHDSPIHWPKDCSVVLKGMSDNYPTDLLSALDFMNSVTFCHINHLVISDDLIESSTIFWTYMIAYTLYKRHQLSIRLTLYTVKYFPTIWRKILLELASGRYTDATCQMMLKYLGVKDIDDFVDFSDTHTSPAEVLRHISNHLDAVLIESHVQAEDVGTITGVDRVRFQDWYKQLVCETLSDPLQSVAGFCAEVPKIGNVSLTSDWFLRRFFSGDTKQFTAWGVPVVLPTVLPKTWCITHKDTLTSTSLQ